MGGYPGAVCPVLGGADVDYERSIWMRKETAVKRLQAGKRSGGRAVRAPTGNNRYGRMPL